jgi:hypothetical protein
MYDYVYLILHASGHVGHVNRPGDATAGGYGICRTHWAAMIRQYEAGYVGDNGGRVVALTADVLVGTVTVVGIMAVM